MLFHELISPTAQVSDISAMLRSTCAQFIAESEGLPIYRNFPSSYGAIKRVKVRFQKRKSITSDVYEAAFGNGTGTFRERCVVAHGNLTVTEHVDYAPYYVFPVNGFEFMYSKRIYDSSTAFEGVINTIIENLPLSEGAALITDLVKFSYQQTDLVEGIQSGAEIIIHNIPSFYVVNAELYPNYKQLIS